MALQEAIEFGAAHQEMKLADRSPFLEVLERTGGVATTRVAFESLRQRYLVLFSIQ